MKVISGMGAEIDTTKASGKLIFGIFASLVEFERELIRERTLAGLQSARLRGRVGGRNGRHRNGKIVSKGFGTLQTGIKPTDNVNPLHLS